MSAMTFNAQLFVSEQLTRQLINATQDVTANSIKHLANHYGFDYEEAIRLIGLDMIKVERKGTSKTKRAKSVKAVAAKTAFPLPYNGEFNDSCCYALRQNNGLYTQCSSVRKGEAQFCKGCASQMQKTGAEVPEYGTIQQRMAVGIFEYVDPKGRKPVAYTKVMKKYKINQQQALEEAEKFNIIINSEHFVIHDAEGKRGRPKSEKAPKEKGAKGRPKKSKKVIQIDGDDEDDLFATLVAQANETDLSHDITETSQQAKKQEKEAKRLAEKAEKEAKLAAEKAEKEAERLALAQQKEAKKKAEEEEKAAKKLAAEQAKALAEQKKEAEKAAKEAEKAAKEAAKAEKKTKSEKKPKAEKKTKAAEQEDEEEPDIVKKIEFEGKKYLKSKNTGIIYDYTKYVKEGDQVVIGKWNENTNKIEFGRDLEEEEEEEEYDM